MRAGQHLIKHLQRCELMARGARVRIHAVGEGIEFVLRVGRQVCARGQILA